MQKALRTAMAVLSLFMTIAALFFTLRARLLDERYFFSVFTRLDNARAMGMTAEDLTAATARMIAYMEGTAPDIDLTVTVNGERVSMFNERERAHMVDVRVLYQNFRFAAYFVVGLYALAVLIWILLPRMRERLALSKSFLLAGGALVALLLFFGAWVLIDFSSFWTAFHHVFFTNELWLLDPATSRMINMMPLEFFYDIVSSTALYFTLLWAVATGASIFAVRAQRRIREKRNYDTLDNACAHICGRDGEDEAGA